MTYKTKLNEFLTIAEINQTNNSAIFDRDNTEITMIWNRGNMMQINIENVCYKISKNAVFFLNSFHRIECIDLMSARMLRFSKSFLSTSNNKLRSLGDFSGRNLQVMAIDESLLNHLESAWLFFGNELNTADVLQKDMVSLLLKRILMLCCKIEDYENQIKYQPDIVSSFNFLVEDHFSEHHDVAFYASKLNKSPKTLSMLFSLVTGCPPKDFIHDRIMTDARKQIQYTHKSIKEIAYDLGYEDIQTFSRFFKNKEGISPLHYREKIKLTDNTIKELQFSA